MDLPPQNEGGEPELEPGAHDDAEAYHQKSKMLVRLVAGGLLLVGVLNLTVYWLKCHKDQVSLNPWRCLWLSIPLVVGVVMLIKTSALAARIEEWLEE
jgi:hypothetical protein